jgi:hypothetical protein
MCATAAHIHALDYALALRSAALDQPSVHDRYMGALRAQTTAQQSRGAFLLYRFHVLATRTIEDVNLRHSLEIKTADEMDGVMTAAPCDRSKRRLLEDDGVQNQLDPCSMPGYRNCSGPVHWQSWAGLQVGASACHLLTYNGLRSLSKGHVRCESQLALCRCFS